MRQWASVVAVVFAAILSTGGSCGGINPPNPVPTPTPTPGPTPTPPGDAIQFSTAGGVWGPRSPFGFVGCCNTPSRDGAQGWTFADQAEIDAYASAGGTLAVFRTGPYSDQGNGWAMIQGPPGQESRLRKGCKYANSKGVACLVEAGTDHWSLKNQNREYQLYNDSCEVTHSTPLPRYQRWSREVVHQVGDLKVLWSLGNEGWLCNPTKEWYDGLVHAIRQAETDFGFPHHPIGNVYKAGEVPINVDGRQGPLYDFVEVHGPPEAFCNQPPIGIPIIWTESENESPPESNQRMLNAKACADTSGGKKAALLWRGGIPDDQWRALFATLDGVAPQVGPRVDSACLWNKYEQTYNGKLNDNLDEQTLNRMKAAVEGVIAGGYNWLFTNNGNNLISTGTPDDDYQRIDYFSLLVAYLSPACTIAGNPDAPNSFYEVDNIELQINVDPCAQSGEYIGWHPIIFGNPGNYNQVQRGDQLRQSPSVFKGRNRWSVVSPCTGSPGPTPTPTPPGPDPTPTPDPTQTCGALGGTICNQGNIECPSGYQALQSSDCDPCCKPQPTPPPGNCPVSISDVTSWRTQAKSQPTNQQIDITPVACGPALVAALNNCGTSCCELSAEKGNQACATALYGMPDWTVTAGVRLVQVYPDNTYTMKVAEGTGNAVVCGIDARSCVHFPVQSTPPACPMVGNQGCALQ